jgi:hypothetical protein
MMAYLFFLFWQFHQLFQFSIPIFGRGEGRETPVMRQKKKRSREKREMRNRVTRIALKRSTIQKKEKERNEMFFCLISFDMFLFSSFCFVFL